MTSCTAVGETTLVIRQRWATVFGGEDITYHVDLSGNRETGRKLAWRLAAGARTIQVGETAPKSGNVRLQIPEVKEGVVVELRLEIALVSDVGEEPVAVTTRYLHAFPRNPFAERKRWLEEIRLYVFDPGQRITKALKRLHVPFKEVAQESMIPAIPDGTLLIGEGVSWGEYASLVPNMLEAAARGVAVLCLAPSNGKMCLPVSAGSSVFAPVDIRLRRSDIVQELDKHLDVEQWRDGKHVVVEGLRITGDEGHVIAVVCDGVEQWPWLELRFPNSGARLVVCGFGITQAWEAGPTPRFLLLRLLEHITKRNQPQENDR